MGKLVVVGASGFVGQALVRELAAQGLPHAGHGSKTLNLLAADAPAQVAANVEAGDTVVLLSALTPEKGDAAQTTVQNIQMVQHLLAGLKNIDIQQLIYISSDAVYPLAADKVDETTPVLSDGLYGYAHILREKMLQDALASEKLTILRPCAIYGQGDTHNAYGVMRFIRSATEHKEISLFGEGEEYRDHLHVDDLVAIIIQAATQHIAGIYSVASGKSWRFMEIAQLIAEHVGDVSITCKPRAQPIQHRHNNLCKLWTHFPGNAPRSIEVGVKQVLAQQRIVPA